MSTSALLTRAHFSCMYEPGISEMLRCRASMSDLVLILEM